MNKRRTPTPAPKQQPKAPVWKVAKGVSGAGVMYRLLGNRILLQACKDNGVTLGQTAPGPIVLNQEQFREIAAAMNKHLEAANATKLREAVERSWLARNAPNVR